MKKWIALMLAMVCLCCAAGASAQTVTAEQLSELEAPLAGLLAADMDGGMPYPGEDQEITNEYALMYLFYMANIFYAGEGQPLPDGNRFDLGVTLDRDEADFMLSWAFGDLFAIEDLAPDGEIVTAQAEDYVIGLSDGYPLAVTYEGLTDETWTEEARYAFSYALTTGDGGVKAGTFEASVDWLEEDALCVTGLYRDSAADDTLGNWYAPDGSWFSLMEESLVFRFDGENNLIGQGSYLLEDGNIQITLDNGVAKGTLEGNVLTLIIDGGSTTYEKRG